MLYILILLAGTVLCGLVWFPFRRRWPLKIARTVLVIALAAGTIVALRCWQLYGWHGFSKDGGIDPSIGAVH